MGILTWIIVGGIAGWLASMVMKTDASQGIMGNIIVGVVGGLLGGFLASLAGLGAMTGFNLYSLLIALVGSVVLLWIVKLVRS